MLRRRTPFALLALWLAVAVFPGAARAFDDPPPDGLHPLGTEVYEGERLSDFCNGAAPVFEAYGFIRLVRERFETAASAEVSIERYEMASPEAAYGLFSFALPTAPVEVTPLLAAWGDGVGHLLSGDRAYRVNGMASAAFFLHARTLAARGAPPARLPTAVAGLLGGPGVRLVRVLPTIMHLENHQPDLAALPSLATRGKDFLLTESERDGARTVELRAHPEGPPFTLSALARELPEAGFPDVRNLGPRIVAGSRRGTVELSLEGPALLVRRLAR